MLKRIYPTLSKIMEVGDIVEFYRFEHSIYNSYTCTSNKLVSEQYRGEVDESVMLSVDEVENNPDYWERLYEEDGTNLEMPIDKVTIDNLDIALRMVGINLDRYLIDKIIDLVELIENKGDNTSIKDVVALQEEWKEEQEK